MKTSILTHVRMSKWTKVIAAFCCLQMLMQGLVPNIAMALTSGPTQPEVEGFQPVGITEMVDPFSGDFSYSIPLMDIGGYPLNLSYQSGISMDQEASWTGLGWNLHTGAITRQLRGLPDDFMGDAIVDRMNQKPNITLSVSPTFGVEVFGFDAEGNGHSAPNDTDPSGNLSVGLNIVYNNYYGLDIGMSYGFGASFNKGKLPMNAGLGLSSNKDGLSLDPSFSMSGSGQVAGDKTSGKWGLGIGASINSRRGLTSIGLNASCSLSKESSLKNYRAKYKEGVGKIENPGGSGGGIGSSSSFDLGAQSFTPEIQREYLTRSFTGTFKVGGALVSTDLSGKYSISATVEKLKEKGSSTAAYGYIYSERANDNEDALLDYNREKDGNFSTHHNNLPVTSFTNDVFNIAAQGLSGTFRPYRNDIGFVYDNKKVSPSLSGSLGAELDLGNLIDLGVDINLSGVNSKSGVWKEDNNAKGDLPFRAAKPNEIPEPCHFRMMGEKIPESNPDFYNNQVKGNKVAHFNLLETDGIIRLTDTLVEGDDPGDATYGPITQNARISRQPRNTSISTLTVSEVLKAYPHMRKYISNAAKPHHIGAVIVLDEQGKRYVFGLAAYNTLQVEKSFAVGGTRQNPSGGLANNPSLNAKGLVEYANANDIGNGYGIDNYYQSTETPAYAHSWLLTEILTPDYVDVTGDGPTQDDLGAYVVFHYGKPDPSGVKKPDVQGYGWRTPTNGQGQAGYMEGLRTDPTDDKANIVYGQKDIWYCHAIESKTHRATFFLETRFDAQGVLESGQLQNLPLQKLSKIELRSLDALPMAPPIKTVHFTYDYRLCPQTPNSIAVAKGKLTLTKVHFTYENSNAGAYSPYNFAYRESDLIGNVFRYNYGESDRWGTPKPSAHNPGGLSNGDYPYASQLPTIANDYAAAWCLNKITLPMGGEINVQYESDDYSYVQDRRAAAMFTVAGFAHSISQGQTQYNNLCYSDPGLVILPSHSKTYLLINVPSTLPSEFKEKFLLHKGSKSGPMEYLYFRFLMNVNKTGDEKYEYVSGYAELEDLNLPQNCGMISPTLGYVKVKLVQPTKAANFQISPFAYAAQQFSRIYTPRYAYNQPQLDDSDLEGIAKTMASGFFVGPMMEIFKGGVQKRMFKEGYGCKVDAQRSWVRLFDPDMKKLGGGARVKRIEITNNWDDMAPQEASATYGQEFSYVNEDGTSSGVAAWEPAMGADENPMRLPVYNKEPKVKLVMDERFYIETPVGESLFPSPSVGYARVEVKDIVYDPNITSKSTGKTVHQFYTAKDFPVKLNPTEMQPMMHRSDPIASLLSFGADNFANFSQGYMIELNDMHGKPKATEMFAEGATSPFAYTLYNYKLKADKSLDSKMKVVQPNGTVTEREVGVDVDIVADFREQGTKSHSGSLAMNLNFGIVGPFPLLGFSIFPNYRRSHTRFRSATVTKVIQRSGLQVETVNFDKGALLTTRTVALDAQTGNPIVQELDNEYKDKYYKTDYPAHWAYKGMGQASRNVGFVFGSPDPNNSAFFNRGTAQIGIALKPKLQPGDEVIIDKPVGLAANTGSDNAYHYWVSQTATGDYYLIDATGRKAIFPSAQGALYFKVVRSGFRNLQNTPVGLVTTMESPINGNGVVAPVAANKVIASSAGAFREEWQTDLSVKRMMLKDSCDPRPQAIIRILNAAIDNGNFPIQNPPDSISNAVAADFQLLFPDPFCWEFPTSEFWGAREPQLINSAELPHFVRSSSYPFAPNSMHAELLLSWGSPCGLSVGKNLFCECCNSRLISIKDNSAFPIVQFNNIQHFDNIDAVLTDLNGETSLLLNATMSDGHIEKFLFLGCWRFSPCHPILSLKCVTVCDPVNPYLDGLLGNWRPWKSYVFQGNRNNTVTTTAENLRTDGYLPNYIPFWNSNTTGIVMNPGINSTTYENWNWANEMTLYSPYGFDLENRNPLGQYSAALYGYKNLLSTAVGNNARHKELVFDGFEDYYRANWLKDTCPQPGRWFAKDPGLLTTAQSHSGFSSMKFKNTYTRTFNTSPDPSNAPLTRAVPYVLHDEDLIPGFSPNKVNAVKRFVVSFWTKAKLNQAPVFEYGDCIALDVKSGVTSCMVAGSRKTSKIVEGWQKMEYYFDLPANSPSLSFEFTSTCGEAYLDDIRVHPYNSNMKSFVYNPYNLRYTAELDENNFATFYEYDQEGKLVRVKKETERGIMTIQETRTNLYKHQ